MKIHTNSTTDRTVAIPTGNKNETVIVSKIALNAIFREFYGKKKYTQLYDQYHNTAALEEALVTLLGITALEEIAGVNAISAKDLKIWLDKYQEATCRNAILNREAKKASFAKMQLNKKKMETPLFEKLLLLVVQQNPAMSPKDIVTRASEIYEASYAIDEE